MLVGKKVREMRLKRSWSQTKLADIANVPQTTISTIENKTISPDSVTLNKLAIALGTTVDNLLNDENAKEVTK